MAEVNEVAPFDPLAVDGNVPKPVNGSTKPDLIATEFVYADGAGSDVKLCGSWANWVPIQMYYEGSGLWTVLTAVPIGEHEFRFIVDGEWKVSTHHPTVGDDLDDTLNNYRKIVRPPPPRERLEKPKGREWDTVKRRRCVLM
uniref:AMP-activated protein kinase glycogen-binding domain-containing protein n=1 Tax=Rhodosorus marinus TaxID=101924 RepID=A0A7S3EJG0_9RHOD|mmetsp:Transcript_40903/g.161988  ORF Transcript_40903/g.161988 Transcript_40903/m.161988 type:complete len:142 (+) Transcript_40903:81-506(+)